MKPPTDMRTHDTHGLYSIDVYAARGAIIMPTQAAVTVVAAVLCPPPPHYVVVIEQ